MNTQLRSLVAILAGVAIFIAGVIILPEFFGQLAGQPAYAQVVETPTPTSPAFPRTISVSGAGSFDAQPDQATIVVGVTTDAKTATEALTQNNQQMQAVISALSGSSIDAKDIRTQTVQLYPRYNEPTPVPQGQAPTAGAETNRIAGYTASNTVQVTVRKLDTLGAVLDQVVAAGGNQIQSVQFSIADPTKAMDQARQAAMQDASHRAQQLAGLANAKLGPVVSISEASQQPIPFQSQGALEMRASPAAGSTVPVSPGSQTVTVNVQVT